MFPEINPACDRCKIDQASVLSSALVWSFSFSLLFLFTVSIYFLDPWTVVGCVCLFICFYVLFMCFSFSLLKKSLKTNKIHNQIICLARAASLSALGDLSKADGDRSIRPGPCNQEQIHQMIV